LLVHLVSLLMSPSANKSSPPLNASISAQTFSISTGAPLQRLEDHLVADLADPHLGALEAEFLRETNGLGLGRA